jgi:Kef-type K+ transport system membrane component KefB/nucleotide-binding universal stress UspA family protein
MAHGASVFVFLAQVVTLLVCGRFLGELMQRIGQPPVMGQLIAGILLGPSCLGALLPSLSHSLFPSSAEQKAMLDALSQLGILLLLLMTGMETDLSVFRDARRTAVSISLSGIIIPFVCGVFLGELLPDALLPDPSKRLITTLFLGTALSISSVKIVALVVRDLGFLRRTVGQMIIASAIIDDTIGWIIMSVIFGLALHGTVDFAVISRTVVGAAIFLLLSFTVGRRLVLRLIRWANDSFRSEMPVISVILAITLLMALLTDAIGLHLVLGAFVAGILIGQSPMLTRHVGEQLRGLIIALFMPIFFGVAGLTTDLAVLAKPNLLQLTLGLVLLASIGKFTGAFIGGRIGGLSYRQSLAVGCGMNARGSTEVIVASIGLSMGALNQSLYTAIVAMAVVTTTSMPPMLKWALRRLPMDPEEKARLEREEFEAQGFLTRIERILVVVDDSPSGKLASQLVGLLAGVRRIPTTVLDFDASTSREKAATESATETIKAGAQTADEAVSTRADEVDITTRSEKAATLEEAIVAEAKKGYGLLAIGLEPASTGSSFDTRITRTALSFEGPFAITIARERHGARGVQPARLNILVPITGTSVSRDGAELAIALAQASQGSVTTLYVSNQARRSRSWRHQFGTVLVPENSAAAAIREIVELGEHYGVEVRGMVRRGHPTENAIIREIDSGGHNLVVMGVSPRPGDQLFFGDVAADVLERARCSILFVSGERR